MSADTFHSVVENKLKNREVYDWRDLLDLISLLSDQREFHCSFSGPIT